MCELNILHLKIYKLVLKSILIIPVVLHKPYKLCDYRICYGAVFQDFIKNYDFWGFCDIDLLWGNIRTFITEGILNKYDKIGFQGHSTLVRNIDFL